MVLCLFIGLMLPITSALAWKNGSYAYHKTDYSYDDDYGTHDWIAEAALDALVEADSATWDWLNQEERKVIFLLGTEAPDNGGLETHLDGELVEGFGDTVKHHVYFTETGEINNNEDDSALRAKSCADLADSYLEQLKYEKAAFYLGAMTHYIADLAMYAHVAENNVDPHNIDFDEHHSKVEGYVDTRTNDYENTEEFFEISSPDIKSDKKPYDLAKDLAWKTYKDEDNNGDHDAVWLHNNFFSDWASDKDDRDSDIATHQEYYDRTEYLLNEAIEASASAMAYVGGLEEGAADPLTITIIVVIIVGVAVAAIAIIIKVKS